MDRPVVMMRLTEPMLRLLVFVIAWLLWSGRYTLESPLIAAFGALSCIGVALLSHRMQRFAPAVVEHTVGWRVLGYPVWLLGQIIKSNLAVARVVLHPKLPLSPRVVRVPSTQRGDGARVLLANSITLTPGTLSMDVGPDYVDVHALTAEIAEDLLSGQMDRKVSGLEGPP